MECRRFLLPLAIYTNGFQPVLAVRFVECGSPACAALFDEFQHVAELRRPRFVQQFV